MASNPVSESPPPVETDWKLRYTDLVNELDHLETTHTADGLSWKKAVSRLTEALHDHSQADNNDLQSLTATLSNSVSVEEIAAAVNDFCLRLPDPDSSSKPPAGTVTDGSSTTLSNGHNPAEFQLALNELCEHLNFARETTELILAEGHSPAARLKILCQSLQQGDLGDSPEELDSTIIGLLLRLLNNLPKFPELNEQIHTLSNRLNSCGLVANLQPILEDMAPLADEIHLAIEQERQQNASFLNVTWQRLAELSSYLESTSTDRKQTGEANNRLKEVIQKKVTSLMTQANTAESLPALQQLLGQSVEQIRNQVNSHVAEEIPRLHRAEEQCQQLAGRVEELQDEADALKQALEDKQLEANRDPLTNLANRRALDKILAKEHTRWQRHGHPLSLIFLDVDFFKRINDTYGHKTGDATLISIARILRKSLREHDFLARYGGEEFVALLPDTGAQNAFEVAEKLRSAIMDTHFHFHEQPVQVTISCGISAFADEDSPEEVIRRADAALYEAKHSGRNQSKMK